MESVVTCTLFSKCPPYRPPLYRHPPVHSSAVVSFPQIKISRSSPIHQVYGYIITLNFHSGITGNGFVIHASLQSHVFRVDRSTVVFIRHLAITDLLYVILNIPPLLLFLINTTGVSVKPPSTISVDVITTTSINHHALQQAVDSACYVLGNVHDAMVNCNIIFILVISLNRFLRCLKPLQISTMTAKQEVMCVGCFWSAALAPSFIKIVLQLLGIIPNYELQVRTGKCVLILAGSWQTLNLVLICTAFVFICLSNLGLLILSLSRHSRLLSKRMRSVRLQAFLITGGISCIFVISWLPAVVEALLSWLQFQVPQALSYATHLYIFNTFLNPIFYAFANTGYLNFLQFKVKFLQLRIRTSILTLRLWLKSVWD